MKISMASHLTITAKLSSDWGPPHSTADTVALSTDNVPPVADAGPDRTGAVGTTLELDGVRAGDAEGDALAFDWALVVRPPASSTSPVNPNEDRPSLLIDVPGFYVVQLIVDDDSVESAPDTFTISVVDSAPVADAGTDQTVSAGELVSLDGGGSSDIDGDLLSFRWALVSAPAGSLASLDEPSEVRPRFTADLAGTYVAQLIVEDATRPSLPDTVVVTTGNSAPVAEAGPDQTVVPDATVQLDGSGSFDTDSDGFGFRWSLSRYVYDGEDILVEFDGAGALLARYSHGQESDQPLAVARGGQEFFYHADQQGSVRKITDAAGLAVNSYDYDSYGNIEASFEGIANPFTYTGRELDAESGLYYYRARYYDPATGRFLQEDPIGFGAGDLNLYRYVFNDPVNFTDPDGEAVALILVPVIACLASTACSGALVIGTGITVTCATNPKACNISGLGDAINNLFTEEFGGNGTSDEGTNTGAEADASGKSCPDGGELTGGGDAGSGDEKPKPDLGTPGTARNPDGTPKSSLEQLEQIEKAQQKDREKIKSIGKSEQRADKQLKDLRGNIEDIDPEDF